MTAATPSLRVEAARLPLEQVASNPHIDPKEKVAEAARQFEAILLRQILADVRKPILSSGLESEGAVNDIYSDIINQTLADSISRSGMLGLARSLVRELTHQTLGSPEPSTPSPAAAPAASTPIDTHE